MPAKQLKRQMACTGKQRKERRIWNATEQQQQQQTTQQQNNIQMVHTHGSHISQFL